MAFDPHANYAYAVVSVAPSPSGSGTTLTLAASAGAALFPDPGARGYNVTIWPEGELPLSTNAEIARVTGKVGLVLTLQRAVEDSSARSIVSGDQIALTVTKKTVTDIEEAIPSVAGLISAINVSAGTTSNNLSALTFSNSNGVSFGLAGSVITGTVATNYQSQGAYLTTARASNDAIGLNTAQTRVTWTVNSSGLSLDAGGYAGTGFTTTTAAGGVIAGTHDTAGLKLGVPAFLTTSPAQSNQTVGLYAGSNTHLTSSGTADARSLTFRAAGPLSIGYSAGELVFSNVGQSSGAYLTTAALSQDSTKYAGTGFTSAGGNVGISGTHNTAGLSLSVTVAAQSNQSAIKGLGASNTGNTAGNTGVSTGVDWVLAGSNNITISQSTVGGGPNTLWVSGANVGGAQTGISGIVASDATYTSGTVTFTGVGGGVTVKSNTGQRIDISVAAQTVQTQNMVAVSLSGNTAGVMALVSSGTVVFAGGNNITVSQNGQSVTISGANVGGAQTGISGLIVSDATYTSGTVSFSNAGNITISSSVNGATQYIRLSGNAAQTTQSAIKAFGVSNTGATAGNTGVSTGVDWVLAGSQSLTLSQSTAGGGPNTVWIQHPAWLTTATQSTQFMALTLGGNTLGTSTFHATNNASLFLNGGNNITLSGNGSTVTISAAAQTNQSAIQGLGVSNTGNTAGNTGISTGINWVVAGSNNITISQSTAGGGPNTIWVSGPSVGGAQTGISGIIVSDATYTSGTVSFSNAGNITIASSVNGATQFIRLSGNAAQTTQSAIKAFGVSNTGQTAGNTGVSTGIDWVLAGSGSITLSQGTAGGGPNTVWVQHPAWLTTAALSQDSSKYAGTGFTSGGANVGISGTNNTAGLSLSITAAAQSVQSIGLYASSNTTLTSSGTVDARSLSVRAIGSLTVGYSAGELLLSAANALTSQSTQFMALTIAGNTLGTSTFHATNNASLFLNGGNNITLSGNGSTVTISAANQTNQAVGIYASSNTYLTSSGTVDARSLSFRGDKSITIGISASEVVFSVGAYITTAMASNRGSDFVQATAVFNGTNASGTIASNSWSVSVLAQSNQTLGGYAVGNTTGQSSSTTIDARSLSFHGAGNVSVGYSGGSVVVSGGTAAPSPVYVSAGTTDGNLGSIVFSNSNGVSFGLNGSTITGTVSTYNTVGTATSGYPVASANSIGTESRWAAEDHRHAGIGAIGISTGNTIGTTGSVQGTYWLAGSNNITVSQVTSNNGSHTLVVQDPPMMSQYDPFNAAPVTNAGLGQSTVYFVPFDVPYPISASRVNLFLSLTHTYSGAPANSTAWLAAGYGLYTRMTGTGSDRMSLLTSYSLSFVSGSVSSSTRLSMTHYIGLSNATSHSTSQYGVNNASVSSYIANTIAGFRVLALPMNVTLMPGRSWLGVSFQSASQGASFILGQSVLQNQYSNNLAYRVFNQNSAASNASFYNASDGMGIYSAQTAAFPNSIPLTSDSIRGAPVMTLPYFNFSGIGTAANIL